MTVCFKIAVVGGFLISAMNFGTDVASMMNWSTTYQEYQSHADDIVEAQESDASSNFKADSEWFMAISAEWEAASDFDKEYVYCDVMTLQSIPDELYNEGSGIWMSGLILTWMSGFAFVVGWIYLFWLLRKMCVEHNCQKNCAAAHRGSLDGCHYKDEVNIQKQKREVMRWSAIRMLMAAGPMVAINYLIVQRRSQTNGFECHEMFYDCGVSGSCDMSDLMVPVALNSSYLDLITSNTLMMLAIFSGLADIAFSFLASLILFIRAADIKYIWLPVLTLVGASLTVAWLLFLDEKVNVLTPATCILLIAHLPILVLFVYGAVCFCIEGRKDTQVQYPQMDAEQKAALERKQKLRMKKDFFHYCLCGWCGPCCRPGYVQNKMAERKQGIPMTKEQYMRERKASRNAQPKNARYGNRTANSIV